MPRLTSGATRIHPCRSTILTRPRSPSTVLSARRKSRIRRSEYAVEGLEGTTIATDGQPPQPVTSLNSPFQEPHENETHARCRLLRPSFARSLPCRGRRYGPSLSAHSLGQYCRANTGGIQAPAPRRTGAMKKDAPNVLIILLDDVGFGQSDTFGGEIHTPTLSRLRDEGISYNCFHTTSICSPTRAALLTGRNHQRVGNGTIAERAVDWDGYTGMIPKTSATIAEVLHHYGYKSAAIGKWHNTPADQTTAMGPFDRWPNGHGFDYFYGFLAGETSQWEPRLFENRNADRTAAEREVPSHRGHGRTGRRLVAKNNRHFPPTNRSSVLGPGGGHGPHHIFTEWADKYKGKFDDGWDAIANVSSPGRRKWAGFRRTRTDPRADTTMARWDSIPESERPFQRRLMEVYAGFVEHIDAQVGKARRRTRSARRPRQHNRHLHLRRQRLQRRRPEWQRSANCSPRTTSRTRFINRSRLEQTWRAGRPGRPEDR